MIHTFDTEVAELFHDANIATIFQNLCYWILHNKTNDKNQKLIEINGSLVNRYFTFNSIQAFVQQFPYYSKKQIETYLNKLRDRGLIVKGNFNDKGFDRTSWYCLVDEQYWIDKYLGVSKKPSTPLPTDETPQKDDTEDSFNHYSNSETPDCFTESIDTASLTCENETTSVENLQSFHFPKRGNAFLQNGKSISPNGEMHFSKTGNPFPQTGKPIPDINSYPKPNNKQNTASAIRTTLQNLDPTLILDSEFYPAAADFLNRFRVGEEYLIWFYNYLKSSKRINNFSGYFFTVFFREVYIQRYQAQLLASTKGQDEKKDLLKEYLCPVCGNHEQITQATRSCSECDSPIDPAVDDIPRLKALYRMDDETKELYISARSQALRSGGNVSDKLRDLDRHFGLVG